MAIEKQKLDKGDRVEIQYGHPTFLSKEEWKVIKENTPNGINEKPKNILREDDTGYLIDLCPQFKGERDEVSKVVNRGDYEEYELKDCARFAYYRRTQLKLL